MRRSTLHASRFLRIGLGSLLLGVVGFGAGSPLDGTEALGVPVGIKPPVGTDFIIAGVGLNQIQPGTIDLTVPGGVAIVQVLAYWEGLAKTAEEQGETDSVTIGGIDVTGVRIGGPTQWVHSDQRFTSSYRADITDLGLVVNGPNSISVSGLDFTLSNDGMSIVVAIDDGSGATLLDLQDGNDSAYFNWPAPLDTTEPVTYAFPPASFDRPASLGFVVGSVDRHPTIIEISFDGVVAIQLNDVLGSFDGSRWDTLVHDVTVPAGASSVTVQILSENSGVGQFRLLKPASLVWVVSTFDLEGEEPPADEGCSPGYWRNHLDSWADTGYSPDDVFDQVFGVQAFGDRTLLDVLEQGGGGLAALGRHAVAALLNAAHPDVGYPISEADVLGLVHDAITSGDAQRIKRLKNRLDRLNNFGCPLS